MRLTRPAAELPDTSVHLLTFATGRIQAVQSHRSELAGAGDQAAGEL